MIPPLLVRFPEDVDRSEANDVADQHPERLEELKALWLQEAKANNVLPLNDLQIIGNPEDFETFIKIPPTGRASAATPCSSRTAR